MCAWKEMPHNVTSSNMRHYRRSHICLGYPCTAAVNVQEISKEKEAEEGEKGGSWWPIFGPDLCVFILTSWAVWDQKWAGWKCNSDSSLGNSFKERQHGFWRSLTTFVDGQWQRGLEIVCGKCWRRPAPLNWQSCSYDMVKHVRIHHCEAWIINH